MKDTMPRGDGLKTAWMAPAKGTRGTVKRKDTMPKGDGLKTAWADQASKPSKLTDMAAAKKRVR